MNITIFGAGYVGLTAAACFASAGHQVICVEANPERLTLLRKGESPIQEPGMESLLASNLAEARLHFTDSAAEGVHFGELLFIAVGTPPHEDGAADLRHVMAVADAIGEHVNASRVIVNKSTVPVGTAEQVHARIALALTRRGVSIPFQVCSNPEFMKEGSALDDFTRGARIIVGTDSEHVRQKIRECYAPYNRKHDKLIFMDVRSAEMTKYAANAMLACRISFMNEMANIAEQVGADIEQVRVGIGSDPRIGYPFLYAGCGYGGSCFPKDLRALQHMAQQAGYTPEILQATENINHRQKKRLFEKLHAALGGQLQGRTIAIWGLAFKPGTDDMREAPSRALLEALWQAGAIVQAYDPVAMPEAQRHYGSHPQLRLARTREDAVHQADALVICTEWKQFRAVNFSWLRQELRMGVVVDGRNLYEPTEAARHGIAYLAIGRAIGTGDTTGSHERTAP